MSLNANVDTQQLSALNESTAHTVRDLFKRTGDKYLESDCDEQLLLHIPMSQTVKLRALRFTTADSDKDKAPKTIRLFVNNRNLGFDDAASLEAVQEIVLTEAQASGSESVGVRFVRFQGVQVLSIFVVDNQGGGDVTRIDGLDLIGSGVDTTDMKNFAKVEEEQ